MSDWERIIAGWPDMFAALRAAGYSLSVDQYIRGEQLLVWLGPVLRSSPDEQHDSRARCA